MATTRREATSHGDLTLGLGTGLKILSARARDGHRHPTREAGGKRVHATGAQGISLRTALRDQAVDTPLDVLERPAGRNVLRGAQPLASILTTWYSIGPRGVVAVILSPFLHPISALPMGLSLERRSLRGSASADPTIA